VETSKKVTRAQIGAASTVWLVDHSVSRVSQFSIQVALFFLNYSSVSLTSLHLHEFRQLSWNGQSASVIYESSLSMHCEQSQSCKKPRLPTVAFAPKPPTLPRRFLIQRLAFVRPYAAYRFYFCEVPTWLLPARATRSPRSCTGSHIYMSLVRKA